MLINIDVQNRPPVYISESDRSLLSDLLDTIREDSPAAAVLGEEIDRATVVPDTSGRRFVRLGSQVEIETIQSGRVRTVRLAMPEETDIDAGDLSILTLAGAALIGLSEGAAFAWRDPQGRKQSIRVLKIIDDGGDDDEGPSAA
ncbi:MAG: GreA/GreB family elongation factor [Amphiplicatus sp.]